MESDELNTPQDQKKERRKFPLSAPQILAGALGLFAIVVVTWAILVNDPLGGEPTAVAATGARGMPNPADTPALAPREKAVTAPSIDAGHPPAGSKTITIIDGSSGKRQEVVIPDKSSENAPQPSGDQRLLEPTRHGAIPKVAPDGTRPATLYARPR